MTFPPTSSALRVRSPPLPAHPSPRASSRTPSRSTSADAPLRVCCANSLPFKDRAMSVHDVPAGKHVPQEFNVIIEIPMNADPIKYEIDKQSGALFVDRFMLTAMHYPCNYGYVPRTLADDDDPVDVLVHTPFPLLPGVVVRCRPLGVLRMDDEAGGDAKLLAVPADDICPLYMYWKSIVDVP